MVNWFNLKVNWFNFKVNWFNLKVTWHPRQGRYFANSRQFELNLNA